MTRKLEILRKYKSGSNSLLNSFYIPVLSESVMYERAVGYFSSGILVEYVTSLKEFYKNNGKMRLIISPKLLNEDLIALEESQEIEDHLKEKISQDFHKFLEAEDLVKKSAELFFKMIVTGILEVKVAIPTNPIGMFHEKIGIFTLKNGDKIAISGSNNETYSSVSVNHESFNTFCSWKLGQNEYIEDHESDFKKYWSNTQEDLIVMDVKSAVFNKLFETYDTDKTLPQLYEELDEELGEERELRLLSERNEIDFTPYQYQADAAQKLLEEERGILKFATGSGKTKTAILFMQMMKNKNFKNFFLIVVPDKTLMEQWENELSQYNSNILKCYSENPMWMSGLRERIDIYNLPKSSNQVIITTIQTLFRGGSSSRFLKQLNLLKNDFVMIVDECHRFTTTNVLNNLPEPKSRIGLSATPETDNKEELSNQMIRYFGGIVAEYSLKNAIEDGKLVTYNYHPIVVSLTETEMVHYKELTLAITRLRSMYDKDKDISVKQSLDLKTFERARIVYGAENKIKDLKESLIGKKIEEDNLLIYCGATSYDLDPIENEDDTSTLLLNRENDAVSLSQLDVVNTLLFNLNIKNVKYTQKENTAERKNAIDLFRQGTMSTLVAIKCLDEGVDIPEIRNAVILSSSGNIREFIQRRGRILRRSPGKEVANIYDYVVRVEEEGFESLNLNETFRLREFASLALNGKEVKERHEEYILKLEETENAE